MQPIAKRRHLLLALAALSITGRSTSALPPRIMPSNLNALSAVMLAALLLCAHGASIGNLPTDSPVDDSSGEEVEPTEEPTEDPSVFALAIHAAQQCVSNFAAEFHMVEPFTELKTDKSLQLPTKCPSSLSKEACLKSAVEGLQIYMVLLEFVESQYPNKTVSETKCRTLTLKNNLVLMMKNPQRVTPLSSSQEEQLKNGTKSYTNAFSRKMAANSILKELRDYLVDSEKPIINRYTARKAKRKQPHSTSNTTC